MRIIHKYHIERGSLPTSLMMPVGAQVRSTGLDPITGFLVIWAEVETDNGTETRSFAFAGTGHPLPSYKEYIGTVRDGRFVWHVYEV